MGRRVGPALWIVAPLALALAAARWASADTEAPLVIAWSAPAGCPARDRVERRVLELLGGAPEPGAARLVASGVVEAAETKFVLQLKLERNGHTSTRRLESTACETLSEAGALVVALAFDPDAVQAASSRPPPEPPGPPSATPAPSVSASAPPPPTAAPTAPPPIVVVPPPPPVTIPWVPPPPARASRVALGFGVGVDFLGDYGTLPGLSPGVRARVSLTIDAYRVEPLFEAFPSATATLGRDATVGADFSFLAGGLRACRRLLPWAARASSFAWLTACLDGEVGEITAAGFGVDKAITATALWGAAGAELEGRLAPPGPVGVVGAVGFVVPFDPRPFVVETPARDEVFASAPISLRLGAGLDARF